MKQIRNIKEGKVDELKLQNKLWGSEDYETEVSAFITYDEESFQVKFLVKEAEPLREKKHHFEYVHEDSCVEFFVNFTPEHSDKYINFEVNAGGVMNVAFRSDRYHGENLTLEEVEGLHIAADVQNDFWTVTYTIGFDFIKKYYPAFDIQNCEYLLGNLYKCGDKTAAKHYLSYFMIDLEQPDFHRPELFDKIYVAH